MGYPTFLNVVEGLVRAERERQDERWGEQNHDDGTGEPGDAENRDLIRERCEANFYVGAGTWRHILDEEVAEAYAETDPWKLRRELVQVAAVAMAWVECIDRRTIAASLAAHETAAAADAPAVTADETEPLGRNDS